jgi:hypothetical protein
MRFFLRTVFWLGVVLVLLPHGGSQPAPKSQVSASEALSAAQGIVTDIEQFCERRSEACVVGSRTALNLSQRVRAGAKIVYDFVSEQLGSHDYSRSVRTTEIVPLPAARPAQQPLGVSAKIRAD